MEGCAGASPANKEPKKQPNPGSSAGFAARLATSPCEREPAVLDHGYSVDRREAKAFVIASAVGRRKRLGEGANRRLGRSICSHALSRTRGKGPNPSSARPSWRAGRRLTH